MRNPNRIGRYEIIEEIGRGAMGLVYLARDPRLDRRVAIKTIKQDSVPAHEADETRRRFYREAQAAGKLQHPSIVTIYDVGEHQGNCFIAMEYIEGVTLERYALKGSLLPVETVIDLMAQACEGLDYAHRQHLVHRDIKPANLMLEREGKLKITDFGLAKNPAANLTHDGVLMGTPNYMSPEQVMGRPLDGRSDLFSLGAVLYELLTGDKPFGGETVTTIIYRIVNESPRPPRKLNASIPPAIGAVVYKSLEKDPLRRFQTGGEFARALQARAIASAVSVASDDVEHTAPVPLGSVAPAAPVRAPREHPAHVNTSPTRAIHLRKERPEPSRTYDEVIYEANRRHRVRATAVGVGALAIVLLAPSVVTRDDRWGLGDRSQTPPFHRTAGILAGSPPPAPVKPGVPSLASAAPAVAVPSGVAPVAIAISTDPPGGRIFVDDQETPGGQLTLPADDQQTHSVVAENDCAIEKVDFKLSGARQLKIPLKTPKVSRLPVASTPPGARVLLDGADTGLTTPADLTVPACGVHTVALKLPGYKDIQQTLEGAPERLSLTLARIPRGRIRIEAAYPVQVFEKGQRLGTSGQPIELTSGSHALILRNEELFVERKITVSVPADRLSTPDARLPGLGTISVLASPSNCTISINGREVGAPPIIDQKLAAGTYTVRAVYVPTGEVKESTVTVAPGGAARVPFKFNP